jgi:hypothetical protein
MRRGFRSNLDGWKPQTERRVADRFPRVDDLGHEWFVEKRGVGELREDMLPGLSGHCRTRCLKRQVLGIIVRLWVRPVFVLEIKRAAYARQPTTLGENVRNCYSSRSGEMRADRWDRLGGFGLRPVEGPRCALWRDAPWDRTDFGICIDRG